VIGKGGRNEIRLSGWRVAKEHARLFRTPGGVLLEDAGTFAGVSVNGRRVEAQYGPLKPTDDIVIGPYRLRVLGATAAPPPARPSERAGGERLERAGTARARGDTWSATAAMGRPRLPAERAAPADANARGVSAAQQELEFEWRRRLHNRLLETMDLRRRDVSRMSDEALRTETEALIRTLLNQLADDIPPSLDQELLCRQVLNEAVGLGPLEELLADDTVSEIMVNRFNEIYVERAGRLHRHPLTFTGDRAVMGVIERIVAPLGRRIDEASPMVDARLKDGSRVNAIIAPLALKGPALTIRKFSKRKLTADDLVQFGSLSPEMARFLEICVVKKKNVIVSGGTGSGKTTLLNILSNFIPDHERVITIEDAAELKLHHEHLVSLESRPPNLEGKGGVPIRDLVRNSLRMRPDRIVVGECRGAEALDMLQAMNTGHEGSLTTLHANTPRDALARLETMVLMAGMDLPLPAIRDQIASAVDVIVQQTRFACGSRLITHIVEVAGMESGVIQLQELFRFVHRGYHEQTHKVRGVFSGCNMAPRFYEDLRKAGDDLEMNIFRDTAADPLAASESAYGDDVVHVAGERR
jgi:pilus assembly protein CpaF